MNIIPFNFESKEIRVVEINNEPWFVATDVASVLEYRDAHDMTRILDDDEKGTQIMRTLGGEQSVSVINESGLYSAILRSRKPEAKAFKKWVTSEVLPSIRKNGGYIAGQETDDPELIMAKALQVAQNVIERKSLELQQAKEIIEIQTPKAEFVDRFVIASTGSKTFRPVAKLLNINERKFRAFLVESEIQYWIGGEYLPYQKHIDAGRFEVKAGMNQLNGHACNRVLFTPKGIEWVAQLLAKATSDEVPA